jgi:hypothetical protein
MASADPSPQPVIDPAFTHVDIMAVNTINKKRSESHLKSPIPEWGAPSPPKLTFEPSKHVIHQPPTRIWTMEEIGKSDQGISPNAVSEPFQLFTEEAIKQMRAEILSKQVLENCKYTSNLAHCQLRGFAPE